MACCHKLWADLEGGHISTDGFQEYLLGISCGKYIEIIYIYRSEMWQNQNLFFWSRSCTKRVLASVCHHCCAFARDIVSMYLSIFHVYDIVYERLLTGSKHISWSPFITMGYALGRTKSLASCLPKGNWSNLGMQLLIVEDRSEKRMAKSPQPCLLMAGYMTAIKQFATFHRFGMLRHSDTTVIDWAHLCQIYLEWSLAWFQRGVFLQNYMQQILQLLEGLKTHLQ